MIEHTLYLVDDEPSIRRGLTLALKKQYNIETFDTGEKALAAIEKNPPDLVLLDIGLPGMSGIEVLKAIKQIARQIVVIMITAFEDIDSVIACMKSDAHDYVIKPIHTDTLRVSIDNALETLRLRKEVQLLQEQYLRENTPCLVSESQAVADVMKLVDKVAQSPDTPVLIHGPSGAGKELIAGAIHYKSPNFKGPFVILNCAAIPKDLLESELFGYEKGAFSGANPAGKKGLIEQAEAGTLFLDEVGDLTLDAQAKLLRFLENGEYYKVGGTRRHTARTRIVSATNRPLEKMIEDELFRLDLYYRLGVIKVTVPSLNERREDILPLARFFSVQFCEKFDKPLCSLTPDSHRCLENHDWRGNIRELKNRIERAVLLTENDELTPPMLGLDETGDGPPPVSSEESHLPSLPESGIDLGVLEAHYIREAVRRSKGNDADAAKLLGMTYHAFRYQKKKYDIPCKGENTMNPKHIITLIAMALSLTVCPYPTAAGTLTIPGTGACARSFK